MVAPADTTKATTRRLAPLIATVLIAAVTVADLQIARFNWFAPNLTPTSRTMAIGLVWIAAAAYAWCFRPTNLSRKQAAVFRLLIAFLAWALLSSILAPDPVRSVAVWFGFSAVMMLTVSAVHKVGPDPVLWGVLFGTVSISAVSLAQELLGRPVEIGGRLGGITFEANLLGQLSGLGLVVAATLMWRNRLDPRVALAIAGITLWAAYLSGTRTTWPALGVACVVALATRRTYAVVTTTALALALVLGLGGAELIAERSQRSDTEDLARLSGRVDLWDWSIEQSLDRPFVGYGLGSANATFADAQTVGRVVVVSRSSHNLVLEIARETGLVGLTLLSAALARSRFWQKPAIAPLLAYLAISGLTMPTSGIPSLAFVAWMAVAAWPVPSAEGYPFSTP